MHAEPRTRQGQRIGHQARAEIGTADADADDVGDGTRFQRVDQLAHAQLRGHRLRARGQRERRARGLATQRTVQGGAALGGIDDFAFQLALHCRRQVGAHGQLEQGLQCRAVVALAREVRVQRTDPQRELPCARRIGFDQAGKRSAGQPLRMRIKAGERAHAACFGIE